ncbi:MAG: helix-turn-helix transcriptional regulator [Neisseriaceae bacterium]|nr:helix-turn-helix transcriptional regulator [Neisseriaceae bacterium]MBP6861121.1 helix-turn-helix transcriptional regulator [Neisseriaceae bacterium]
MDVNTTLTTLPIPHEHALKQLGDRIRETREHHLKLSRAALAQLLLVSLTTLQNYEYGTRDPSTTFMVKLAELSGVDLSWLMTGTATVAQTVMDPLETHIKVPLDVSHQGQVALNDYALFSKNWVSARLQADPKDLILMTVKGDSMHGIVEDQDEVLVNLADHKPGDGLYALAINQNKMIKHTQSLPGNIIRISSNNPLFLPFDVNIDDLGKDLTILGRVIWLSRKL